MWLLRTVIHERFLIELAPENVQIYRVAPAGYYLLPVAVRAVSTSIIMEPKLLGRAWQSTIREPQGRGFSEIPRV